MKSTRLKSRTTVPGNGRGAGRYTNYSFAVPREIAELIPDGATFTPELTEDGVLYRITRPAPPEPERELPSWAVAS